jgi:hypothetical protein
MSVAGPGLLWALKVWKHRLANAPAPALRLRFRYPLTITKTMTSVANGIDTCAVVLGNAHDPPLSNVDCACVTLVAATSFAEAACGDRGSWPGMRLTAQHAMHRRENCP